MRWKSGIGSTSFSKMSQGSELMGLLPKGSLLSVVVALLVSSIGFIKYVFFISIGYGYSIAAYSIVGLILARKTASVATWIEAVLLFIYGLRLGTYLLIRETNASYQAAQAADVDRKKDISFGLKVTIWISVSILYAFMYMPETSRLSSEYAGKVDTMPTLSYLGASVTAIGIIIESIADAQKTAAKKCNPKAFCNSGLYRIVRCPNYFGEMLVWTGNILCGSGLLNTWLSWATAIIGYICIILIMIGSARRLELKQEERYGKDPEFKAYIGKVPVIVPLLPIYSLKNAKVYLG